MRAQAERVRQAELARLEAHWDDLSDEDRERLDAFTRSLVNKLLHAPTVWMREAAESGDDEAIRSIATMNDSSACRRPGSPPKRRRPIRLIIATGGLRSPDPDGDHRRRPAWRRP